MEISEIIGMLISIAAILFLVIRPLWLARQEKAHPQEYAEAKRKKERHLKKLMKSLDIDIDVEDDEEDVEEEEVAQKKPLKRGAEKPGYVHEQQTIASTPTLFKTPKRTTQALPRNKQTDVYQAKQSLRKGSRGSDLIHRLKSKKDMIILREIIGPPKSQL